MKRITLLSIAAATAFTAGAQTKGTGTVPAANKSWTPDSLLSRWVIDLNFLGGLMSQQTSSGTAIGGYTNGLNINTGVLSFEKGRSLGFGGQLGYFFGPRCNWGVGTGITYFSQKGDFKLDNYHVEYQDIDSKNNIYRQLITGNDITEKAKITNINIPLMLKYKKRFSKVLGFTMDAGPLVNVQMKTVTENTGSYDYEAIYKYVGSGQTGLPTVYDNSAVPDKSSYLITRANAVGDVNTFFANNREAGYNVGLAQTAKNTTSEAKYNTVSVGLMLQPSLSFYLSDHVALNFGLYYAYQSFKNDNTPNYVLMTSDRTYNSSVNNVTSATVQSYGINAGVRFLFGKPKDTDKDGIPDRKDKCPDVWGIAQFQGCPDTDKDGIQDSEDSCRTIPGLAKFNGCPDSDGDGIPDKLDECPYQKGTVALKGCPDRDGDGIADKNDVCPDKPGPEKFKGCPDTDGDGLSDNEDQCPEVPGPIENKGCPPPPPAPPAVPLSTPILFETNKTVVHEASVPVLETAIKTMADDPQGIVVIHGHADSRGSASYNKALSRKRALAVKAKLVKMGANPKRIRIIAHGEADPTASNKTDEGRAENRRAVMRLSVD
jgi:outer membrane protein OmpA-like peptidoglycan-associated protein